MSNTSTTWRLRIVGHNGDYYTGISEIQMRTVPGGADECVGGTASASSEHDGVWVAARAFDNDPATSWLVASFYVLPATIQYVFTSTKAIVEYTIQAFATVPNRTPAIWYLEMWDFSVAQWFVRSAPPTQTGWTEGEVRTFAVENDTWFVDRVYNELVQVESSYGNVVVDKVYNTLVQIESAPSVSAITCATIVAQIEYNSPLLDQNIGLPTTNLSTLTSSVTVPADNTGVGIPNLVDSSGKTRSLPTFKPWNFQASPEVLGYINNPLWKYPATEHHDPCGYWPESAGASYDKIVGPPMGRVICASVQANYPYVYAYCTNKYLYKLHLRTGKILDWMEVPVEITSWYFRQAWENEAAPGTRTKIDFNTFCVSAIDQQIWLTDNSNNATDKHMMIVVLHGGYLEVFRINLFTWAVVGHDISEAFGVTSARGGHSHGDFSIWSFDSSTTLQLNNDTLEWRAAPSTESVADFDSANRLLVLVTPQNAYERPGGLVTPAIRKSQRRTAYWLDMFRPSPGDYEVDFLRTFGATIATGWMWTACTPALHLTFANYHPTYARARVAFTAQVFNSTEIDYQYTKHTANMFGAYWLGSYYSVSGNQFIVGIYGNDVPLHNAPDSPLDAWGITGHTFDSGKYGAALISVDQATENQTLWVFGDSTIANIISREPPTKSVLRATGKSPYPYWPFVPKWGNYKRPIETSYIDTGTGGGEIIDPNPVVPEITVGKVIIGGTVVAYHKFHISAFISANLHIVDTSVAVDRLDRILGTYVDLLPEEEGDDFNGMPGDWQYFLFAMETPSPRMSGGHQDPANKLLWIELAQKTVFRISTKWELVGDFDISGRFSDGVCNWGTQSPPMTIQSTYKFLVANGYLYSTQFDIGIGDRVVETGNVISRYLDTIIDTNIVASLSIPLNNAGGMDIGYRITRVGNIYTLYYSLAPVGVTWIQLCTRIPALGVSNARIDIRQDTHSSHFGANRGYIEKTQHPLTIVGTAVSQLYPRDRTFDLY